MARGDPEFCRLETEFMIDDARFRRLEPEVKVIYLYCWARAVYERVEKPAGLRWPDIVAAACNVDVKWIELAYKKLTKVPQQLLRCRKMRDGSFCVTVLGVRTKHPKLHWKDLPHTGQVCGKCAGSVQ